MTGRWFEPCRGAREIARVDVLPTDFDLTLEEDCEPTAATPAERADRSRLEATTIDASTVPLVVTMVDRACGGRLADDRRGGNSVDGPGRRRSGSWRRCSEVRVGERRSAANHARRTAPRPRRSGPRVLPRAVLRGLPRSARRAAGKLLTVHRSERRAGCAEHRCHQRSGRDGGLHRRRISSVGGPHGIGRAWIWRLQSVERWCRRSGDLHPCA